MRVFMRGVYRKWSDSKDDFIKFPLDKIKYDFNNFEYNPSTLLEQADKFYRSVVSLSTVNLRAVFIEYEGVIDNTRTIKNDSDIIIHYRLI